MLSLLSRSIEQTEAIGKIIGERLVAGDIIVLEGALASGKTALTKGIALGLGIDEAITSPTFTLISEYKGRLTLYHMDIYRLDSVDDFTALGAEELLYNSGVCVIEWGERIAELMPKSAIFIKIEVNSEEIRKILLFGWDRGPINLDAVLL